MAVVELPIASNGRGYNGKMTPIVILSCMVAATGGIIFGYDIGISGQSHTIQLHYLFLQLLNHTLLFVNTHHNQVKI